MIELRPMTQAEYEIYRSRAVAEYAEDKVLAGNWPEEGAIERSAKEYEHYLPLGLATPDNTLCTLVDCGERSGGRNDLVCAATRIDPADLVYFRFFHRFGATPAGVCIPGADGTGGTGAGGGDSVH